MNSNNGLSSTLRIAVIVLALLSAIVGFLIGRSTATFENAGPQHLSKGHLEQYVSGVASYYQLTGDANFVKYSFCFSEDTANVLRSPTSPIDVAGQYSGQVQLINQAIAADGGCTAYLNAFTDAGAATGEEGGRGLLGRLVSWLLGLVLLAAMISGGYYLYKTQIDGRNDDEFEREYRKPREITHTAAPIPTPEPRERPVSRRPSRRPAPPKVQNNSPQPIGGFSTTYVRGDDSFDKSFIIENSSGDFLGECGVSVSESIAVEDGMRNVTAFEIWLFDKNDTHTVTKVVMSDFAFSDDPTRAKLAVRGEPIRAELEREIKLETNSLSIHAEVTDIDYTNTSPTRGVFDRLTIDLSAWVKPEGGGDVAESADESDLLNF